MGPGYAPLAGEGGNLEAVGAGAEPLVVHLVHVHQGLACASAPLPPPSS